MMSLSRISAIFLRQLFLFRGNPVRLVSIFLWLVIDVIQWGFISKYLGSLGQDTFSFITVILGAIILWEFMARVQQGIMMAFLEDIWTQNFINFFASPLRVREYLCGLVMTSVATSLAAFLIMIAIAGAAFGYDVLKIGLFLLPSMVILLIFGIGMGIFVSRRGFPARPVGGVARLAYPSGPFSFRRRLLSDLRPAGAAQGLRQAGAALLRVPGSSRRTGVGLFSSPPRRGPARRGPPLHALSRRRFLFLFRYLQKKPQKREHREVQRRSALASGRQNSDRPCVNEMAWVDMPAGTVRLKESRSVVHFWDTNQRTQRRSLLISSCIVRGRLRKARDESGTNNEAPLASAWGSGGVRDLNEERCFSFGKATTHEVGTGPPAGRGGDSRSFLGLRIRQAPLSAGIQPRRRYKIDKTLE